MLEEASLAKALRLRNLGDDAVRQENWNHAIQSYGEALSTISANKLHEKGEHTLTLQIQIKLSLLLFERSMFDYEESFLQQALAVFPFSAFDEISQSVYSSHKLRYGDFIRCLSLWYYSKDSSQKDMLFEELHLRFELATNPHYGVYDDDEVKVELLWEQFVGT